jgi:energy-coupling factor transporter ATP-binding protein EcfA2
MTVNKQETSTRAYVGAFNFKGADQQKNVGKLSGGERNRVHMAKMLKQGGNVLLLDEPTNDLDVETLAALEDAIENFAGCAVVISHDRFFLDRLATHILAFEGNSHVEWFEGNFAAIQQAVGEGAEVIWGGGRLTEGDLAHGYFMQPAILGKVTPSMRIAQEEVFGPDCTKFKADQADQSGPAGH